MKLCNLQALLAVTGTLLLFSAGAVKESASSHAVLKAHQQTSVAADAAKELHSMLSSGKMSIPLSLSAIQTTLVKMSKQLGNSADDPVTVEDFAQSIEPLLYSMQDTVRSENNLTQQTLDNAWSTFTACSYDFVGNTEFEDLKTLEANHRTCREEEGRQKTALDACRVVQESKEADLREAKEDFHGEESKGIKGKNELPELNYCDYEQDPSYWNDPKEYLAYFENKFGQLLSEWRDSRDGVIDKQNITNVQTTLCDNKETNWETQKADCLEFQRALENEACDILTHNTACRSYTGCYNREWTAYVATENVTRRQEEEQKAEMMGTLKILCMIQEFGSPDLNQKIQACLATDYSRNPEVVALDITYYPNAESPMPEDKRAECAEASRNSNIPGTLSFENTHYWALPDNAQEVNCTASCCGYAEPTCRNYQCGPEYHKDNLCQCNSGCEQHGDCCWDYYDTCNATSTEFNVVLSEVAWQGADGVCEGADWIELHNAGYVTRDIQGWSLTVEKEDDTDPSATVQYQVSFDASQVIEPAHVLVICAQPGGLTDETLPVIEVSFEFGNSVTLLDKDNHAISATMIGGTTAKEAYNPGVIQTWARTMGGTYQFATPSPGERNDLAAHEEEVVVSR